MAAILHNITNEMENILSACNIRQSPKLTFTLSFAIMFVVILKVCVQIVWFMLVTALSVSVRFVWSRFAPEARPSVRRPVRHGSGLQAPAAWRPVTRRGLRRPQRNALQTSQFSEKKTVQTEADTAAHFEMILRDSSLNNFSRSTRNSTEVGSIMKTTSRTTASDSNKVHSSYVSHGFEIGANQIVDVDAVSCRACGEHIGHSKNCEICPCAPGCPERVVIRKRAATCSRDVRACYHCDALPTSGYFDTAGTLRLHVKSRACRIAQGRQFRSDIEVATPSEIAAVTSGLSPCKTFWVCAQCGEKRSYSNRLKHVLYLCRNRRSLPENGGVEYTYQCE